MKIAIAGGTGLVGSLTAAAARAAGHEVAVLARSTGVDLVSGEGAEEALAGVDAAIDTLNIETMDGDKASTFFRTASGNLVRAAARAGVGHVVLLSIVGIDRNPYAYYGAKLAQEEEFSAVADASAVPWTIVRATQFHEFAAQMFRRAKAGPIHLAPRARIQPVAAREVAEHLVQVATQPAQQLAADLAGPREEQLAEMTKRYAKAIGYRGPVFAVTLPGAQLKGMRQGLNLPGADAVLGAQTFDDWLAELQR